MPIKAGIFFLTAEKSISARQQTAAFISLPTHYTGSLAILASKIK
jgi:hypothetical protein